jgi:hypothetical protein
MKWCTSKIEVCSRLKEDALLTTYRYTVVGTGGDIYPVVGRAGRVDLCGQLEDVMELRRDPLQAVHKGMLSVL